jgi:hypothetical protein
MSVLPVNSGTGRPLLGIISHARSSAPQANHFDCAVGGVAYLSNPNGSARVRGRRSISSNSQRRHPCRSRAGRLSIVEITLSLRSRERAPLWQRDALSDERWLVGRRLGILRSLQDSRSGPLVGGYSVFSGWRLSAR